MTAAGWLQIAVFLAAVLAIAWPLGRFMFRVFEGPPLLPRVERWLFKLCGVDPAREQTWVQYTVSLLAFSAVTMAITYAIERLQAHLPLNPQALPGVEPTLAFDTAAS